MLKKEVLVSPEEVQLYVKYAPRDSAETISKYITNLYSRKYSYLDSLDYTMEITKILERVAVNYKPKLGHLVRYAKNTLQLKMRDYITRNYVPTAAIIEETLVDKLEEVLDAVTLEEYTDSTLQSIYNVVKGRGTKSDVDLVNKLFNVEG